MSKIEQQILKETKGLPQKSLNEILHFVQFIKIKESIKTKGKYVPDNLNLELQLLDIKEITHLEKEFKNYKKLYPRER